MTQASQFHCKAGFLPSVKIKPLNNIRSKKLYGEKYGLYCRTKLKITEEEKLVPDLIEEYYKRFKLQAHKSQPLSISQEELEQTMAKSKQERMKVKSSKNKNRNNSQPSYTMKLREKKVSETDKIKLSTKMILHRLKSFPNSQLCRQDYFNKNVSEKRGENRSGELEILNNVSRTLQIVQSRSKKYFIPKGGDRSRNQNHKNQMSTLFALSTHKKSKQQCRTVEKLNKYTTQPEKYPSPWQLDQGYLAYNPESIQLLEHSLQN